MRAMTVEEIRTLMAHADAPCLSIYMPTRNGGSADDRLRWAALLKQAREMLTRTRSERDVHSLLAPLEELSTPEFWTHQSAGLAAFRSNSWFAYYSMPVHFEEAVVVSDGFHVRPLLRFVQSNQRYFLLNLSHGRVSFFKGSATGLAPVDLSALPRSFTDAVGLEHRERAISLHGGGRGHSPVWHGTGKDDSVREEDQLKFLRKVDKALWEVLRDETAPLVVAGTEKLFYLYQRQSRYPHLLHEGVHGNFDNTKLEDLRAKAWPIVQEHLKSRETEMLERYGKSISNDRALDEVSAIARFAVQGRVRELLLDRNAHLWGRMDKAIGALELHAKQQNANDDDVLDDIAEAVILRGGDVYSLEAARMPTRSPVAATLRW